MEFLEMLIDALDGTEGWRNMETKELAKILEERIGDWMEYEDEEDVSADLVEYDNEEADEY